MRTPAVAPHRARYRAANTATEVTERARSLCRFKVLEPDKHLI
jgi:hypothetical protein